PGCPPSPASSTGHRFRREATPLAQSFNPLTLQRRSTFTLPGQRQCASAFTLLELLIVIGIIALLMILIVPGFTTINGARDVTNAVYAIQGTLESARTYEKASNTTFSLVSQKSILQLIVRLARKLQLVPRRM